MQESLKVYLSKDKRLQKNWESKTSTNGKIFNCVLISIFMKEYNIQKYIKIGF